MDGAYYVLFDENIAVNGELWNMTYEVSYSNDRNQVPTAGEIFARRTTLCAHRLSSNELQESDGTFISVLLSSCEQSRIKSA